MAARKSAKERKTQIADTVLRLADELGPDRLTTQAVADAVGVTQPAIFRHFPTKADLWLAVAGLIAVRLRAGWSQALQSADDPVQRIEALILGQLRQIEAMPAIPSILFSRELQAENEPLRQTIQDLMGTLVAMLIDEIKTAQANQRIHGGLAPQDGALLLVALVQGLAFRWTLTRRDFGLEAEGRRMLAIQMRLFLTQSEGGVS